MHPDERRIYIALLTTGLIVIVLIAFFVVTALRFHRRKVSATQLTLQQEMQIQELERSRIASDLHDDLNSGLSVIKLRLSVLSIEDEKQRTILASTITYVDSLSDKVRSFSNQLLSVALETYGLQQALEELISPLLSLPQYQVDYHFQFMTSTLAAEADIHIYRIFQEIINNILKHSGASRIFFKIFENQHTLFLRIEDNGGGFDLASEDYRRGLGLQNIRMRADILNARMYLTTRKGEGTKYEIEIPKQAVKNRE